MFYLAGFVVAMLITMILIPPVMLLAKRYQFVDVPNGRKVHQRPIPRIGGAAVVLGVLLPLAFWLRLDSIFLGFFWGALIIFGFGLLDDRLDLDYRLKFLAQFAAMAVAIVAGGVQIDTVTLAGVTWHPPFWLGFGATFFFFLAVTNAVNFADGLDGLAGGVVLISLAALLVLSYRVEAFSITLISVVLIGAVLGFLLYNSHPAVIFMGDGGSQFLGFSLAYLSMALSQSVAHVYSAALPLFLVGLPLVDLILVIGLRVLSGTSVFAPDKRHLHHRLLAMGFNQYGAVLTIYLLQLLVVGTGVVLRYEDDLLGALAFAVLVALMGLGARLARDWLAEHQVERLNDRARTELTSLRLAMNKRVVAKWASIVAIAAMVLLQLLGVLQVRGVQFQLGLLTALFVLVFLWLDLKGGHGVFAGWFIRFTYISAALGILYLWYQGGVIASEYTLLLNALYLLLALLVFIGIQLSPDVMLSVRPIDLLVVLTALALPVVARDAAGYGRYGLMLMHMLVLVYAIELGLVKYRAEPQKMGVVKYFMLSPAVLLMLRGLTGI